ncbi:MAG: hemin uptake protein HemP [Thauera sp.]|jgi:hemin uptake protein HemP
MPHPDPSTATADAQAAAALPPARERAQTGASFASRDLLGNGREVRIVHEGSEYVLRATRNGKLILTK